MKSIDSTKLRKEKLRFAIIRTAIMTVFTSSKSGSLLPSPNFPPYKTTTMPSEYKDLLVENRFFIKGGVNSLQRPQ